MQKEAQQLDWKRTVCLNTEYSVETLYSIETLTCRVYEMALAPESRVIQDTCAILHESKRRHNSIVNYTATCENNSVDLDHFPSTKSSVIMIQYT